MGPMRWRRTIQGIGIPLLAGCAAVPAEAGPGHLRIVTYNVARLNSEACTPGALESVFTALNEDESPPVADAPHVYVFQEVRSADVVPLGEMLNAVAPSGVTYVLGTYTNNNEDVAAGAQALFYRPDTLAEVTSEHADFVTGGGRQADRWKLQLTCHSGVSVYIYGNHLMHASGAASEQLRLEGAMVIREDADTLPEGTAVIYAGDMNLYHSEEPAYAHFLSPGPGQAFDPLGTEPWNCTEDPSAAVKHTQSPRCVQSCALTGGCMNDRFDFQLMTDELLDGVGIDYLPGSYRALGNDGQHCEIAINEGDNFYYGDVTRSNALADALHDASDHLPVVVDYEYTTISGDVDGNGTVGLADLLAVVGNWGNCPQPCTAACAGDVDCDCIVGISDFLLVLGLWG